MSTNAKTQPSQDEIQKAFVTLLTAMIGPSYSDAIQENGNIASQIDLCIGWVKGEVSEAVSLIDCCAPHGKPMLAQAQKRLETLEALKLLELMTSNIKANIK